MCRSDVEKVDKIPVIASLRRTKLTVVAATSAWSAERIHGELYGLSYENLRILVLLRRVEQSAWNYLSCVARAISVYLSTVLTLSLECKVYALNEHASSQRCSAQQLKTRVGVGMKVSISDVWIEIKVPPSRHTA